jgi:hypothetical protein
MMHNLCELFQCHFASKISRRPKDLTLIPPLILRFTLTLLCPPFRPIFC